MCVTIECKRKEGMPVKDKDDLKKEREKFFDQLESDKEKMINESNPLAMILVIFLLILFGILPFVMD